MAIQKSPTKRRYDYSGTQVLGTVLVVWAATACAGPDVVQAPPASFGLTSTIAATLAEPSPAPVDRAPSAGPVTAAELGSPETAAAAWLSRWCGYDFRTPMGTRENLAHAAMTERAWLGFDPLTAPPQAAAWSVIVAEGAAAACSTPVALVSPEAPRSATGAYVIVTADRVVTPSTGPQRVEQVRETRQVLLRGGSWLVDVAANGAG